MTTKQMIHKAMARRHGTAEGGSEAGFTLIEVMVAIMIIGILAAVGIPTFLGVRARAHDQAAQAPILTALLSAETLNAQAGTFASATPEAMQAGVTNPKYVDGSTASTGPTVVSIYGHSTGFAAAVYSNSGNCYLLRQTPTGQTSYATLNQSSGCSGHTAWRAATEAHW